MAADAILCALLIGCPLILAVLIMRKAAREPQVDRDANQEEIACFRAVCTIPRGSVVRVSRGDHGIKVKWRSPDRRSQEPPW